MSLSDQVLISSRKKKKTQIREIATPNAISIEVTKYSTCGAVALRG
jgi:hypothetical protein